MESKVPEKGRRISEKDIVIEKCQIVRTLEKKVRNWKCQIVRTLVKNVGNWKCKSIERETLKLKIVTINIIVETLKSWGIATIKSWSITTWKN